MFHVCFPNGYQANSGHTVDEAQRASPCRAAASVVDGAEGTFPGVPVYVPPHCDPLEEIWTDFRHPVSEGGHRNDGRVHSSYTRTARCRTCGEIASGAPLTNPHEAAEQLHGHQVLQRNSEGLDDREGGANCSDS